MLSKSSLFTGGPLRLFLMLLLVLGLSRCPVFAQDDDDDKNGENEAAERVEKTAAPVGAGVMIPVSPQDGATSGSIAVKAAEAISNPTLDAPSVAPVVNKNPMTPLPIPGKTAVEAAPAPAEALPVPPPPAAAASPLKAADLAANDDLPASSSLSGTLPSNALEGLTGGEPQQQAPYMRDLKPIDIFDPSKSDDQSSPIQRVAKLVTARKEARQRLTLAHIQNLATYEYELEGPNEAKICQEAQTRALLSAAGRLYFDEVLILGLDLLEPYLRENGKSFIARTSVLEHRAIAADRARMRLRVSVNLDALYADLENKHFLAKPNYRPILGVFLQEIVNGERNTATGGRARLERTFEENMFQVYSEKIRQPALDTDVSAGARQLKEARLEAERNNVDVVIAGTLIVQPAASTTIYYDNFSFKEAEINLKVYRVDTGELITQVRDRYSAAAGKEDEATRKVLDAMLGRVAQKVADELNRMWPNTMLVGDNYRLLISGVNSGEVTSIRNKLKSLSPNVEIYQKSYLGNVLVLNLTAPDVTPEKLDAFLRESHEPQFTVQRIDKHRLTLDVL